MKEIINVQDIVEANGKSIKQNNLSKTHKYPIGSLVEVKYDEWHGNGSCEKIHARLFVYSHDRDCDGTPLYSLSKYSNCNVLEEHFLVKYMKCSPKIVEMYDVIKVRGIDEESLTLIEVTDEIKDGEGSLNWYS